MAVRKVISTQLLTSDKSLGAINNCSGEADRTNLSSLYRQSIRFLQSISGEAAKVAECLSDWEKQMQAEQSEEDSNTSRSPSLSWNPPSPRSLFLMGPLKGSHP